MSGSIEKDWSDEAKERQRQIGVEWLEDSSLERWFPFTADELTQLRARVKELEAENQRLLDQIALREHLKANADHINKAMHAHPDTEKLSARIRELEEAMRRMIGEHEPGSDCVATGPLTGTAMDYVCVFCTGKKVLADRIEKVMKKRLLETKPTNKKETQ